MTGRIRRIAWVAGVLVLVGGAAGAAITWYPREETPAAAATKRHVVAAERRTLTDSETVSGNLGYDDARTVSAVGAGVLTRLPAPGTVVRRGKVAYRVNDVPVIVLTGALPLWRDLSYGVDDGKDIRQLERNLTALGYDPGTVDEHFSTATKAALKQLQADRDLEETGTLTAAQFLVLPSPIRVGSAKAQVGAQLQPGMELYEATGTGRLVTVDLDPSYESLASVGTRANVTLPDGSTVAAVVSSVGTVATGTGDGSDPSADATIPVELKLANPAKVRELSAAPVTVDLTRETRKDVIVVPVEALVALAEGGNAVRREGGQLVAVETGLYADGMVEITSGLADGDRVEVPVA